MSLRVVKVGVYKVMSKLHILKGGVWKEVDRALILKTINGNKGWREFYVKSGSTPPPPPPPAPNPPPPPPVVLTVTITPSGVSGYAPSGGVLVVTNEAVAVASGGTGPYTYQWEPVSWTGGVPGNATSPQAASTTFSKIISYSGASVDEVHKCVAVDSLGNTGNASVNVNFSTGGDPIP